MKKIILVGIGMMLLFAACQKPVLPETSENDEYTYETMEEDSVEEDSEEEIVCSNGEIEVTVSKEYYDKCIVEKSEERIAFYHKEIREKEGMDCLLFAVVKSDNMVNGLMFNAIAYSDEYFYHFTSDEEDPEIEDEELYWDYLDMLRSYFDMKDKIHINAEGVHMNVSEYTLPMSHVKEIPDEVIDEMYIYQFERAVNEIYARHGLKFEDQFYYEFFSKYSWYNPSIEEADFDENMLSEVERKNIDKLRVRENEYPEKERDADRLAFGKEYSYDLDGDGEKEGFCLRYTEGDESDKVEFTINQQVISEEEYGWLGIRGYYLTDIDENRPGLEIAVDTVGDKYRSEIYFYTYDGGLNCIGYVPYEFTKENEQENMILVGFDGVFHTSIVTDVFFTCEVNAEYVYSYEEKKIQLVEQEMYEVDAEDEYKYGGPYKLTEDILIFKDRNVDSERIKLNAQNVFFLESDLKEWMKIEGEDGVVGYIHKTENGEVDGVGKNADEIIMGLPL